MKFYDTFTKSALVVVDAQERFSDLCPAELPVPGALDLVKPINRLLTMPWKRIIATQDWHPSDHCSFKAQGGPYPRTASSGRTGRTSSPACGRPTST